MAGAKGTLPVQLNESNYATWKLQCKMALMKDGLWRIVEGTEIEPFDNGLVGQGANIAAVNKYIARKEKALATIVLGIEPSLLYLVGDPHDPALLWTQLSEIFQKKTWANKLALRRKLHNLKLNDDEPVKDHIKEMTEIFQELSVIGDHIEEEDRVVQLLASLPESFSMLVTALETSAEVPKIELVTERLLHEERKLKEKAAEIQSMNKAYVGRHGNGGNKSQKHNNNAGYVNNNNESRGPTSYKCFECGKSGHIKRNCKDFIKRMQKQKKDQANVANNSDEDDDCDTGFVVTEVCHALSVKSVKRRKKWIIDSGASKHMSYDESLFHNGLRKLEKPQGVQLGDGHIVNAEYGGEVILNVEVKPGVTRRCKLKNVLYVPDLSCNLVSVSKAVDAGQSVNFEADGCTIVDTERNIISATGKKIGSLWYLNCLENEDVIAAPACAAIAEDGEIKEKDDEMIQTKKNKNEVMPASTPLPTTDAFTESKVEPEVDPVVNKVSSKVSASTWHSRYGHLGVQNMRKLCQRHLVNGFNYKPSANNEFCEPCVEGKHHHQKFPTEGGKRAEEKLELVHTDVCGKN
jgi:hypothetical protein